ncbi:hypothetical protein PHSY_007422 [Pseudozyma hubeiensis SY62]|uniref:Prenyltransferase alpha-alpha toroid domain-containing protein n=1 Tax=Pseudozyma hubeiensis (strain SY62) TaxID=1305764 RepID=R9PEP3_PSEHS|nr:hypothetical protein PHSY_007422 [Pseudozyma hubeiensis SY62]GAC99819.1 hypothetical protein PHSY_007422 [Pseudozyma hubeiensis SY62]
MLPKERSPSSNRSIPSTEIESVHGSPNGNCPTEDSTVDRRSSKMYATAGEFFGLPPLLFRRKVVLILAKCERAKQDPEDGGIADRPENVTDVFHTVFGCAGLSLLGFAGLQEVDPTYCMPLRTTKALGIDRAYQRPPAIEWD